jgi:3',5'-cyclic AMP phosphodiesterase CpdA
LTRPIKIIQVSDLHFGGENVAATEAALARFHAERPDLLIAAGDLTRDGAVTEFDAARAWLDRAPRPQLTTPGNHDTPYLGPGEILERLLDPWRRYETRFGPADRVVWRGPGVSVFAVNTARRAQLRMNWSKGAIARSQVDWLTQQLAAAAGDARIVVCHHPLIELVGEPMTGRVHGGPRAAARLAVAGADLVLSGHIHVPFVAPYPFGDGKTAAVVSGTLSVRERGAPPSFNIIEIDKAEITVTALAFERTDFTVRRTWAFDRRAR